MQDLIAAGQENAQKEAGTLTNWTQEVSRSQICLPFGTNRFCLQFDELNSALVKRIGADPEAASFVKLYESSAGNLAGQGSAGDDDEEYSGPRSEQVNATHEALKVVVGRILQLAGNKGEMPK